MFFIQVVRGRPGGRLQFSGGGSKMTWLVTTTAHKLIHYAVVGPYTLSGNSLRQTVHAHRASVHQGATLVAALLTAGLAESNGSLPPGL